jgi:hypothetical protein
MGVIPKSGGISGKLTSGVQRAPLNVRELYGWMWLHFWPY